MVIVTASPLEGDPVRFTTIVENVTCDDILEKGGDNLADALKDIPGVAGTSFAAGASRPVIRGMDANRVKVLEDGVSSSDVSDIAPDHGVPIDPLSAQSIEVVRGAAPLRYGSQAIGGVVNAINNRVPLTLPDKPLSEEASANYSSAADTGQGSLMADGALGQFGWRADGFARRSVADCSSLCGLPDGARGELPQPAFAGDAGPESADARQKQPIPIPSTERRITQRPQGKTLFQGALTVFPESVAGRSPQPISTMLGPPRTLFSGRIGKQQRLTNPGPGERGYRSQPVARDLRRSAPTKASLATFPWGV